MEHIDVRKEYQVFGGCRTIGGGWLRLNKNLDVRSLLRQIFDPSSVHTEIYRIIVKLQLYVRRLDIFETKIDFVSSAIIRCYRG